MAQFVNMRKVDLMNGEPAVFSLRQLYYADENANRIGAIVLMNGEPFPLSGTCSGTAIRADGATVPMEGTVEGNQAYITLIPDCYAVEGDIQIFVKLTTGDVTATLVAARGTVRLTETGAVIDPGEIIPSVSALITAIDDAIASIPADYSALLAAIAPNYADLVFPVSAGTWCWHDGGLYRAAVDIPATETWTAAHWSAAVLSNTLTADIKNRVSYAEAQTLTETQQATARGNIGAAGEAAMQTMQDEVDTHLLQLRRAAVIEKALVKNWAKGSLNANTGEYSSSEALIYTPDYYLISPDMEIKFTGMTTDPSNNTMSRFAYFYASDKTYISRNSNLTYRIPANAYYVRFLYGFTSSSAYKVDSYGGIDAVAAEWDVESVSAIEKALRGGAASLQSVQPLSSPQSIQALDADGGENE